jgi:hypothetical protein
VTQCAVDTRQIAAFTLALGSFQEALIDQLSVAWPRVQQAHARASRFMFDLVDLRSFCKQLAATDVSDKMKDGCQTLLSTLEPGGAPYVDYIVAEGHLGPTVEDCGGISVYLPSPLGEISRYYDDLAFAKDLGWDDFLRAYRQAVR